MELAASKLELESLTQFQKEIHVPTASDEKIISAFYKVFLKATWYSTAPMCMGRTMNEDSITYRVDSSFHYLLSSYMCFNLPAISVKEEWRGKVKICWPHNVGNNIKISAVFKEDDDPFHSWDNTWADIYPQFYQNNGAGKREIANEGVGNVECLEQFSEVLPRYTIDTDEPWFYSMDSALAYPIYMRNSQTRARHEYKFRRNILDLLRVRVLKGDAWRDVTGGVARYLNIGKATTLRPPELWGIYAYVTSSELRYHRCTTEYTYYTRDIVACDATNPSTYGSIAEVPLECTTPCLAMFWVAENASASAVHNYSNYTTSVDNVYAGWDPIRSTSFKYGNFSKLNKMPSHHFTRGKFFPSAPRDRGYHGHSFTCDSSNFHAESGICLKGLGARLECAIADGDIYRLNNREDTDGHYTVNEDLEDDNSEDSSSEESVYSASKGKVNDSKQEAPKFITRVRLLVARKFTLSRNPADDKAPYVFKMV